MDYGTGLLLIGLIIVTPILFIFGNIVFFYNWQGLGASVLFVLGLPFGHLFAKRVGSSKAAKRFILISFLGLILVTVFPLLFSKIPSENLLWIISLSYLITVLFLNICFQHSIRFRQLLVTNKNFTPKWFGQPVTIDQARKILATLHKKKADAAISKGINYIITELDQLQPQQAWGQLFFDYLTANEQLLFVHYNNFYGHAPSSYNIFFTPLKNTAFFSLWQQQLTQNETAKRLYAAYLNSFNEVLRNYIQSPQAFKYFHKPLTKSEISSWADNLQHTTLADSRLQEESIVLSNQLFIAHKIALEMG